MTIRAVSTRRTVTVFPLRSDHWPSTGARTAMSRPLIVVAQASALVVSFTFPKGAS